MKCVLLINVILVIISMSKSNLYDFPALYKFDDYDACLGQKQHNSSPIFAMVYAEIKPNNYSELWQQIVQYNKEYPFRYRHDRLFFGVCVQRCKTTITTFEYNQLTDEDLIKNEITDYFANVHKRPLDIKCRKEYHELIHHCLNQEFQQKYDLNLRTFIEYCEEPKFVEGNNNEEIVKDPLEILLYATIVTITMLNILSSLYDFRLNKQQTKENQSQFYKINHQQTVSRFLTSFSIKRNYYRFVQPYSGAVGKDFQFLDGYRSISMLLALNGHTYFSVYQHMANPQYFEKSAKDENSLWILNTTTNVETFFVMSGLLLFIKFQQGNFVNQQTSWKKMIFTYINLMAFRFIRLFPSMASLLLVNATCLQRLQDGPFWRHITEPVRVFSRERGWRNLLMINNFSHKESASHHTWYLAADWQLFALYLLIIMIVSKYPKYKKYIYSFLAILSFVIPFSISYLLKLEPSFIIKPETYRYSFFNNIDVYYDIYIKFYTNLFGYLIGIICAEIYLKYTHKPEVHQIISKQILSKIALFMVPIIAFLICWLGIKLDLKEPSIWSALYAGIHRNLWIIFICGLPTILMSCKCGGIAYQFCCLPIFRILARLSFQVYIWHMTIIYMINGYQRQPYYVNDFYFFTQYLITYTISHILAFFLVILVEYPLAQSMQILQSLKYTKVIKKS